MAQFYIQAFKICDIYFMGTECIKAPKIEPCCISPFQKGTYIEQLLPTQCTLSVFAPSDTYYHLQIEKSVVEAGKRPTK